MTEFTEFSDQTDHGFSGLQSDLHAVYSDAPDTHDAYRHLNSAVEELELPESTLPGFDALVHRKEFKEFVHSAEELASQYASLTEAYRAGEWNADNPPQYYPMAASARHFQEALGRVDWQALPARDVESVLRATYTMSGLAEDFRTTTKAKGLSHQPSMHELLSGAVISPAQLKEVYWLESQRISAHQSSRGFLANLADSNEINQHTRKYLLQTAYQDVEALDLVPAGADPAVDRLRREVGEDTLLYEGLDEELVEKTSEGIALHDSRMRQRVAKLLKDTVGLDPGPASRYMYALLVRSLKQVDPDTPGSPSYISGYSIRADIEQAAQFSKTLGPPTLNFLSEKARVVNFDRYTGKIINDMMDLFYDDDQAEASRERMRQDGVTVVFATAYSDHNGAFNEIGANYSDKDATTLLFEVGQLSDFYRALHLLKKHNIKATTFVVGTHSNPGDAQFSNGSQIFHLFSGGPGEEEVGNYDGHSEQVNWARLTSDEFMMDDAHGERRIILNSCSSAQGRASQNSHAETIVRRAANPALHVIGARDVSVIGRTNEGKIHFANADEMKDESMGFERASSLASEFWLQPPEISPERKFLNLLARRAITPDQYMLQIRRLDEIDPTRPATISQRQNKGVKK